MAAKGISIRGIRSSTYALGKGLGDVSAISKGKFAPRIARRVVGKYTGRGLRIFG
jgi:hypothetical protein